MATQTRSRQQRSRSKSTERKNTQLAKTILRNIEKNKQQRPRLVIPKLDLKTHSPKKNTTLSSFIHWLKHFFTIMFTFWLKRNIPLDYHLPCIVICGLCLSVYCYVYE